MDRESALAPHLLGSWTDYHPCPVLTHQPEPTGQKLELSTSSRKQKINDTKSSTIQDDGRRRDGTGEKIINHQQESGCRQHDRWHLEGNSLPCPAAQTPGELRAGPSWPGGRADPQEVPASTGPMSFPAEEPLQGSRAPPRPGAMHSSHSPSCH